LLLPVKVKIQMNSENLLKHMIRFAIQSGVPARLSNKGRENVFDVAGGKTHLPLDSRKAGGKIGREDRCAVGETARNITDARSSARPDAWWGGPPGPRPTSGRPVLP
jgi:hypothetical protein